MHTGLFATAVSTIFWTQTLVNGTFHVHTESRFAGREHADIIPSPSPIVEREWLANMVWNFFLWHAIITLRLHTNMKVSTGRELRAPIFHDARGWTHLCLVILKGIFTTFKNSKEYPFLKTFWVEKTKQNKKHGFDFLCFIHCN